MSRWLYKDKTSKLGKGRIYPVNFIGKDMYVYIAGTFRYIFGSPPNDTGHFFKLTSGKTGYFHYDEIIYMGSGIWDIKSCKCYDIGFHNKAINPGQVKGIMKENACIMNLEHIIKEKNYDFQVVHLLGKNRYKGIGDIAIFPKNESIEWKKKYKTNILATIDVVSTYQTFKKRPNTTIGIYTKDKDILGLYNKCKMEGFPVYLAFSLRSGGLYFQYLPLNPDSITTYFRKRNGEMRKNN